MKPAINVIAAACTALLAVTAARAAEVDSQLRDLVFSRTGMLPDSVRESPVPGIYEVDVGRQVFYVDRKVDFLFAGRIFDVSSQRDITGERIRELSKVDWGRLDLRDAIKVVYGKGENTVAVFTDAKCTYCSILEKNLREAGNVTVYNFIYPILNSMSMGAGIWCSKNPARTWQEHMLNGVEPPSVPARCDYSALERNLALGHRLGFTGTPTIIFRDGSNVSGAVPAEHLARIFSQQKN